MELGELMARRTAYARETLAALDGVELAHEQPVVREFAVALDVDGPAAVRAVVDRCAAEGVNPGYPLGDDYDEYPNGLLVAITEQRSRQDIDRLADVLGAARCRRAFGREGERPGVSALSDNQLHRDPGIDGSPPRRARAAPRRRCRRNGP